MRMDVDILPFIGTEMHQLHTVMLRNRIEITNKIPQFSDWTA
jgi:hypothetical protein